MNAELLAQLIQLVEWSVSGLMDWKANQATNAQFADTLKAALNENRPLTADEWAPIDAAAQAAHDALANA